MMVEPKLRFKADDGSDFPDWEEEMLGELVEIQRGGSPRPISKFITTGRHKLDKDRRCSVPW